MYTILDLFVNIANFLLKYNKNINNNNNNIELITIKDHI